MVEKAGVRGGQRERGIVRGEGEAVEKAEVILGVEGDAAPFPAGVDRRQPVVEGIDGGTGHEGPLGGKRGAVGEADDRVFGIEPRHGERAGVGGEDARGADADRRIGMMLHVGIAETKLPQWLPPHVPHPGHARTAPQKDVRTAGIDRVVNTRLIVQRPFGEGPQGRDAGADTGAEEGVGHAPVDADRPGRAVEELTRAGQHRHPDADRRLRTKLPARQPERGESRVDAVVRGAEEGESVHETLVDNVAGEHEKVAVEAEGVDVRDWELRPGGVGPARRPARKLEPAELKEATHRQREGELPLPLVLLVKKEAVRRSEIGGGQIARPGNAAEAGFDPAVDLLVDPATTGGRRQDRPRRFLDVLGHVDRSFAPLDPLGKEGDVRFAGREPPRLWRGLGSRTIRRRNASHPLGGRRIERLFDPRSRNGEEILRYGRRARSEQRKHQAHPPREKTNKAGTE